MNQPTDEPSSPSDAAASTREPVAQFDVSANLLSEARSRMGITSRRGRRLDALSATLGVGATVLAAVAAVTVIPKSATWVTGVTAGLSALVSGLRTAFNPSARARASYGLSLRWKRLGDDIDTLGRRIESQARRRGPNPSALLPQLWEEAEDQLSALRDRRDDLLEEETGSPESVLERAEHAFEAAQQSAQATTEAVIRTTLDHVRGLPDDVASEAEGAIRRMLGDAVPNNVIDDVVDETNDRVGRRLQLRALQLATLLSRIAPDQRRAKAGASQESSSTSGVARLTLAERGLTTVAQRDLKS